jgi:trimeric autotransporter adhesin
MSRGKEVSFKRTKEEFKTEQAPKESQITMSSAKQKLRLAGALVALATLAVAVSCKGFFVNPTVSTITVDPPTPSVSVGATQQMSASATFSDGSGSSLKGGTSCTGNTVCWSSSDMTIATITTGGLLTGVAPGTASITATSSAITGTTTATVTLGNVTGLNVNPTTISIPASSTQNFTAMATLSSGSPVDVTSTATWTSSDTTLITVQNGQDPMVATTGATAGTATVTATYISNGVTYTATSKITVE